MTTLTTERLVELRDRLKGAQVEGLTLYVCNCDHRVDTDAERDIIAALSRLIEAEAENVRLQAEIDANAWSISPAMAQATIEQHWERIQKLQAELAAAKETIATLQNQQYGTPCEQIRHAHEVEALRAELAAIKAEVGPQEQCPLCQGTGKVDVPSFQRPTTRREVTCPTCKGSKHLPIDYKHRAEHLAAWKESASRFLSGLRKSGLVPAHYKHSHSKLVELIGPDDGDRYWGAKDAIAANQKEQQS